MKIKGQGTYVDRHGNKGKILGISDLPDEMIETLKVTGTVEFDEVELTDCNITGTIKGARLVATNAALCGTTNVNNIEAENLKISGKLKCDDVSAKNAEIQLSAGGNIGNVNVGNLQISSAIQDADVDLKVDLPFFKLSLNTKRSSSDNKEYVQINNINAESVGLCRCDIEKLICNGGVLKNCCVNTLDCKGDIQIDEQCVIRHRI